MIRWESSAFSPTSISSAPYTLYFFLHSLLPSSLLSCPLFHSDFKSNFLISISLFCYLTLKVLIFLVQSSFTSSLHFRLWVASKTMTFGEIPQCLCLWSVWAPWPLQASLNLFKPLLAGDTSFVVLTKFLMLLPRTHYMCFSDICIIQSIICVPKWDVQGQKI